MVRYAAPLFCAAAVCPASTTLLYNGSLGTSPGSQGFGFTHGEVLNGSLRHYSARFFNAAVTPAPEPGTNALAAIGLPAYVCRKRSIS